MIFEFKTKDDSNVMSEIFLHRQGLRIKCKKYVKVGETSWVDNYSFTFCFSREGVIDLFARKNDKHVKRLSWEDLKDGEISVKHCKEFVVKELCACEY